MPDTTPNSKGARANVVAFKKAEDEIAAGRRLRDRAPDDPPPLTPRGPNRVLAGQWSKDIFGMPSDPGCECPVVPIGFEGGTFYLVDSKGQFREFASRDFSQDGIQDLFSAQPNYPKWMCPRWGKEKTITDPETGEKKKIVPIASFDRDAIKEVLFQACTRKGFFAPSDRMRGRGAWTDKRGSLLYHAGEQIWRVAGRKFETLPTGVHEGYLYPRLSSLPTPWKHDEGDNPARVLLEGFRRANWTRPAIDPVLLLGWVGAAYLGGALEWRPSVLLLGDKGTGKSTLQHQLREIFGEALFHSSDTTAAGIYQAMAHDSRAVAIDELEPGANPGKVAAVADLMRTSASGAIGRRGSSGGTAGQFQMRSAFLFSAINNPLQNAADLSRCAVLRIMPFDPHAPRPERTIDVVTTGPMVLAQLMRAWGPYGQHFESKRRAFAAALAKGGHDARGQDTYGILLTCAALLLGDDLAAEMKVPLGPEDEAEWTRLLPADGLAEVEDAKPNYRKCIDSMLSAQVDVWRHGQRNTVGKALTDLIAGERAAGGDAPYGREDAKRDLELAGLGLRTADEVLAPYVRAAGVSPEAARRKFGFDEKGEEGRGANWILCIPNDSPLVARLLRDSDAFSRGGWKDALRQCPIPGVVVTDKDINRITINGVRARCTLVAIARYNAAPER